MHTIKNIIFDVGKVLVEYEPTEVLEALIPDSTYHTFYLDHLFHAQIWQDLDRGDVSKEEAIQILTKKCSKDQKLIETELEILIDKFAYHLAINPDSKSLFIELAQQYPLYILSNFQDKPFDLLVQLHPFMKQAKGMIVSAKVNMMKPEKEIYELTLTKFQIAPQETVFIDDLQANIDACEKEGIHGVLFESAQQTRKDLQLLGIRLSS